MKDINYDSNNTVHRNYKSVIGCIPIPFIVRRILLALIDHNYTMVWQAGRHIKHRCIN